MTKTFEWSDGLDPSFSIKASYHDRGEDKEFYIIIRDETGGDTDFMALWMPADVAYVLGHFLRFPEVPQDIDTDYEAWKASEIGSEEFE